MLPPSTAAGVPPPPRAVVLFFGANDAARADRPSARQHVPVTAFKRNVVTLVEVARQAGAGAVVVVTPPPVDAAERVKHAIAARGAPPDVRADRDLETTGAYAAAAKEAAAR